MSNIDTGNTGFMLLCSSLVMLMTPGLAFFYGGLVSRRNVLAIMMQSFVSMGWTTVIWFAVGYSLCFSGGAGGVIGNLDMAFLSGVTLARYHASSVCSRTSLCTKRVHLSGSRPQASQSTAIPRVLARRSRESVTEVIEW